MNAMLLYAVLSIGQPAQGYVLQPLPPSPHPASFKECLRYGAAGAVATINMRHAGQRVYHTRACVLPRPALPMPVLKVKPVKA